MDTLEAVESLYALAYTFLETDRLREATHAFRVMLRCAPTDERAWLGLAQCHERAGDDEIAAELYGGGSVASSPPSVRCLVALSRIARARGDLATAREHLEEASTLADEVGADDLQRLVRTEGLVA